MASRKKGPRIDIVVVGRILDALYYNGDMKKTQLYMASRLSYKRFSMYLDWLMERGLVEYEGEHVRLTKKGSEIYVKIYALLNELLERF